MEQLLQLIDEEEWFNLYGLRAEADKNSENENEREARRRFESEFAYQEEIHAKIFAAEDLEEQLEDDEDGDESGIFKSRRRGKGRRLEKWENDEIDILTSSFSSSTTSKSTTTIHVSSDTSTAEEESSKEFIHEIVILRANLKALASRSDMIFTMAYNQHLYSNTKMGNWNDKNSSTSSSHENGSEINDLDTQSHSKTNLSLSLCDYPTESVKIFLRVLLSSPSPVANSDSPILDIPPEHVIDCCRLAHYLQCHELLDLIVDAYLMAPDSISSENCLFLCKLADNLSLPRLWEASVNHMLSSLDKFSEQGNINNDDDNNNSNMNSNSNINSSHKEDAHLWRGLSPALKKEIQALRGILQSSNRKQVYFSTYHEYLGILGEQHEYYRERFENAKHGLAIRLEEENALRSELERLQQARLSLTGAGGGTRTVVRGEFVSYRNRKMQLDRQIESTKFRLEGIARGKEYATSKIEKQAVKVDTLKALLVEQKKIFGGSEECENCGPRFEQRP